ncbi:MAG: protein kinase, partial [Acidobacteriota bacterium]
SQPLRPLASRPVEKCGLSCTPVPMSLKSDIVTPFNSFMESALETGSKLGAYRILEHLGSGGMGEVYLAHDPRLDRNVALKILPQKAASDAARRDRFEREAKAIAALNHPNIVTIHSVEEAGGVHFLTMELVEGETLTARIPPAGLFLARISQRVVKRAGARATRTRRAPVRGRRRTRAVRRALGASATQSSRLLRSRSREPLRNAG